MQVSPRIRAPCQTRICGMQVYELRHAVRAGLRVLQRRACLLDGFLAHAGLQIHYEPNHQNSI